MVGAQMDGASTLQALGAPRDGRVKRVVDLDHRCVPGEMREVPQKAVGYGDAGISCR